MRRGTSPVNGGAAPNSAMSSANVSEVDRRSRQTSCVTELTQRFQLPLSGNLGALQVVNPSQGSAL
eukprot:3632073-Prymnesium_polylepis.1